MKEINTDKTMEFKLRINSIPHIERLSKFLNEHKNQYKTINDFLIDMIFTGLENYELYEKDAKTHFFKSNELATNVSEIQSKLMIMSRNDFEKYKDLLNVLYQNQLLLARIYNALFKMSENGHITKEYYDNGIYDDLPERFESDKEKIATTIDAEFGISKYN